MPKEAEYRINAFDSLQLADHARSVGDRVRLLQLAEAWMKLADRARQAKGRLRRPQEAHPVDETETFDYGGKTRG